MGTVDDARKAARRESDRRYRERNREKINGANRRRYRSENPEVKRVRNATDEERAEKRRVYKRAYYAANRERILAQNRLTLDIKRKREYDREYRAENPEKWRAYYATNVEQIRARARAWYRDNYERARETRKQWARTNPDSVYKMVKRYQASKRGVAWEPWTSREVLERDGWECQLDDCRHPDGRQIDPDAPYHSRWAGTADHVVPVSKGGADTLDNLQAAHRSCNAAKGNRVA
jgi:5-methylcytosine-specific restriction endonuclease McrA